MTTIHPLGPYDLRESATFGFGQRLDTSFDGVLRMAFCVDGYAEQAGVEVRQDGSGVQVIVHGEADPEPVTRQVARILSLDHDGEAFQAVGRRDPVLGRLQAVAPGLRPPQFHSPYEAAAWAVLSARRPARQMARVRQRLSEAYGRAFELAGQTCWAFPTPARLLEVTDFPELPPVTLERLQAVARAALGGRLSVERLTAADPDTAMAQLRELPGHRALLRLAGDRPRLRARRRPRRQPGDRAGGRRPALRPARPAHPGRVRGPRRGLAPLPYLGGGPPPRRRPPAAGGVTATASGPSAQFGPRVGTSVNE